MRQEEQKSSSSDLSCIMCKGSDETHITGPLSCKQGIAAHQNCLLFSSGLYCKHSPTYDDLFGFDVEDVEKEARRGRKLKCHFCNKTGATAGCEIKSCKRSYHYPCAHKDQAITDESSGNFMLYCAKHIPNTSNVGSDKDRNGKEKDAELCSFTDPKSSADQTNNHGGSEEKEISQTMKRKYHISFSDSDETDLEMAPIESEFEDNTPPDKNTQPALDSEYKSKDCKKQRQDTFADTESYGGLVSIPLQNIPTMALFSEYHEDKVPFTVIADSGTSVESENSSDHFSSAPPSPAGAGLMSKVDRSVRTSADIIDVPPNPPLPPGSSFNSGESYRVDESTSKDVSVKIERCSSRNEPPLQMSFRDELPGSHSKRPRDHPLDLTSAGGCCTTHAQSGGPVGRVGVSDSSAALFWRRCSEVGCTDAIFTRLTRQLSSLAEKVKNQHATEQDYAVSLRILEASGTLPETFERFEQDFEDQERQLKTKRRALRDAKAAFDKNQFNQEF